MYALRSRRQRRTGRGLVPVPATWPAVDVVVPCFNEDPSLLEACCRSVAGQDYPGPLRVWLVDDGSRNQAALLAVYEHWAERGWDVRAAGRQRRQAGRPGRGRPARDRRVCRADGLGHGPRPRRHPLRRRHLRRRPGGAISGSIGVLNAPTNLLTRLIHHRYRLRFQVERPAQGFFTSLLCCSGPFAVYRRSLLDELWEGYLGQTPAGVRCTNGDDLHSPTWSWPPATERLSRGHRQHQCPRSLGQPAPAAPLEPKLLPGTAPTSPASGPGTPTWPWTCSPGPCRPCCWRPPSCCL